MSTPVVESEALGWAARGSRRPAGSGWFQEGDGKSGTKLNVSNFRRQV